MQTHVIYHKDCMDGLASAFIAYSCLLELDRTANFIPMHYNEVESIYDIPMAEDDELMILDFSLPNKMLMELSTKIANITIIDHHKTAIEQLDNLPFISNLHSITNTSKSGAMLTYEFFADMHVNPLNVELFQYVQDRDLWTWQLPATREISASLALNVEQNCIRSFAKFYWYFEGNKDKVIEEGTITLRAIDKQVQEKVDKCTTLKIEGVPFKVINATQNISELGNAICNKFDMPACLYFILSDSSVVLSFRSLEHLEDVSVIAKCLKGGGHRNSAGATVSLDKLSEILKGER